MNGSKESVRILPSSSIVLVDVGKDIALRRAPKALQKAKHLRSLGVAVRARLSQKRGQSTAFDKGTVLSCDREEA
jgi:hypothetical protein